MKKGSKELLKIIISNQELIMKALNIDIPAKKAEKQAPTKVVAKSPAKKAVKKVAKKVAKKSTTK